MNRSRPIIGHAFVLLLLAALGCARHATPMKLVEILSGEDRAFCERYMPDGWLSRAEIFDLGNDLVLLTTQQRDVAGLFSKRHPMRMVLFETATNAPSSDMLTLHMLTKDKKVLSMSMRACVEKDLPVMAVGLPNGVLLKDENCDGHWDVHAVEKADGGVEAVAPTSSPISTQ